MLEYASPLPLVDRTTGDGAHSGTHGRTTTAKPQPVIVSDETAANFLQRAMERGRSLHLGAEFSATFSDEPPYTPDQVMRLIGCVQRLSATYGLRYRRCDGWEFTFKKLAAIPGP